MVPRAQITPREDSAGETSWDREKNRCSAPGEKDAQELPSNPLQKRPITVRELLTFRMGFGQIMAPPDAYRILSAANELQIGIGLADPIEHAAAR